MAPGDFGVATFRIGDQRYGLAVSLQSTISPSQKAIVDQVIASIHSTSA